MTQLTATLHLDVLFKIAESSDLFDRLEGELRSAGHESAANDLMRLQQDAGLEIDREMTGDDWSEAAPGPETAALRAAYQSTSMDRLAQVAGNAIALAPNSADALGMTQKFSISAPAQSQSPVFKAPEIK